MVTLQLDASLDAALSAMCWPLKLEACLAEFTTAMEDGLDVLLAATQAAGPLTAGRRFWACEVTKAASIISCVVWCACMHASLAGGW